MTKPTVDVRRLDGDVAGVPPSTAGDKDATSSVSPTRPIRERSTEGGEVWSIVGRDSDAAATAWARHAVLEASCCDPWTRVITRPFEAAYRPSRATCAAVIARDDPIRDDSAGAAIANSGFSARRGAQARRVEVTTSSAHA